MTSQNNNEHRSGHRPESISAVEPGRKDTWSIHSKSSSALMIIVGFFQAVYGDGLGAIEFWLSLFFAAASQQPSGEEPAGADRSADRARNEIRHRQIM